MKPYKPQAKTAPRHKSNQRQRSERERRLMTQKRSQKSDQELGRLQFFVPITAAPASLAAAHTMDLFA